MASMKYKNVYIESYSTIVGPYEKNGAIKKYDMTFDDLDFNTKHFEEAEVKMQQFVFDASLEKGMIPINKVDLVIGGDLMNQLTTSTRAMKKYSLPFLGVYSACATFTESLLLASSLIDSKKIKKCVCITSSHNLTSERQFRYPIEYGSPKVGSTTFTITGSASVVLSNKVSRIMVESATIGRIVDYGIKDVSNMGAVMAPSALATINEHLKDMNRDIDYYDVILTGDLGKVGSKILNELYKFENGKPLKNHVDAGTQVYTEEQKLFSGASGPAVLPLVLFAKILESKKYKKILIVGTGSLHSQTLVNQKSTIPAISHAVSLEVI